MEYRTFKDFVEQSGRFKGLKLGETVSSSVFFTDDYLDDDEYIYDEKQGCYVPWVMYCHENVSHALNTLGNYCKNQYPHCYDFITQIGSHEQRYFCEVRLVILTKVRSVDPQLN